MIKEYADYAIQKTVEILAIDSPSGFTAEVAKWTLKEFQALGFDAKITNKGGVIVDLGGEDANDGVLIEAHADTLGGMVAQIKSNGRLKLTKL